MPICYDIAISLGTICLYTKMSNIILFSILKVGNDLRAIN